MSDRGGGGTGSDAAVYCARCRHKTNQRTQSHTPTKCSNSPLGLQCLAMSAPARTESDRQGERACRSKPHRDDILRTCACDLKQSQPARLRKPNPDLPRGVELYKSWLGLDDSVEISWSQAPNGAARAIERVSRSCGGQKQQGEPCRPHAGLQVNNRRSGAEKTCNLHKTRRVGHI